MAAATASLGAWKATTFVLALITVPVLEVSDCPLSEVCLLTLSCGAKLCSPANCQLENSGPLGFKHACFHHASHCLKACEILAAQQSVVVALW